MTQWISLWGLKHWYSSIKTHILWISHLYHVYMRFRLYISCMCLFKCFVHWDRALSNELLSEVFIHLWCLFSLMVCFCSNIWLGYHPSLFCTICRVFSVIQTGLNGHGWPKHMGKKQPCWGFAVFGFIKIYEAMCREEGATQTGSY